MNYINIYNKIVEYRKNNPSTNTYTENHHIIPKCLGGDNSKNNLITVSTREHYILHHLLVKIYPENCSVSRAFKMLRNRLNIEKNRKPYSCIRKCEYNKTHTIWYGRHCSSEHKSKISKIHKGKKLSNETKKKISEKLKNKPMPNNIKQKISNAQRGKKLSVETKKKMSIAAKIRTTGRIWVNNGIIQKQIFPENVPDGFVRGRLKRKN